MAPVKVVVVGFGPFPGVTKNPSGKLALDVAHSKRIAAMGVKTSGIVIPTVYREVFSILSRLLAKDKPDIVLLFGLAGSTPYLRVETRAVNAANTMLADAAGEKPAQRSLALGSPQTLNVRAPLRRLLAAARGAGVRAKLSVDAGRYICNAAFFHCLDAARRTGAPKLVAFVHIPWPRGRRRRKPGSRNRVPPMERLQRAGEAILLALIAAQRQLD
jgi:pyroglutamyl-peptidase